MVIESMVINEWVQRVLRGHCRFLYSEEDNGGTVENNGAHIGNQITLFKTIK